MEPVPLYLYSAKGPPNTAGCPGCHKASMPPYYLQARACTWGCHVMDMPPADVLLSCCWSDRDRVLLSCCWSDRDRVLLSCCWSDRGSSVVMLLVWQGQFCCHAAGLTGAEFCCHCCWSDRTELCCHAAGLTGAEFCCHASGLTGQSSVVMLLVWQGQSSVVMLLVWQDRVLLSCYWSDRGRALLSCWQRQSSVVMQLVWQGQSSVVMLLVWQGQSSVVMLPVWQGQSFVVMLPVWQRQSSDWPVLNLVKRWRFRQLWYVCSLKIVTYSLILKAGGKDGCDVVWMLLQLHAVLACMGGGHNEAVFNFNMSPALSHPLVNWHGWLSIACVEHLIFVLQTQSIWNHWKTTWRSLK